MITAEPTLENKRIKAAVAYASRLLATREYSEKTLLQKMRTKEYTEQEAEQALIFLKKNQWQSDERFCQSFVRSKIAKGQGLSRIAYELKTHGINPGLVEEAMASQFDSWQSLCEKVARRKVAAAKLENNLKDRQKLERFLRYRGFSSEQIRMAISNCLKSEKNNSGENNG